MDYTSFYNIAKQLLIEFGKAATLQQITSVRNPVNGKTIKKTKSLSGLCVMSKYDAEAIAKSNSVIQAGDVKLICQFPVRPVEVSDKVIFGTKYNIINVETINPDTSLDITYIIQGRKA